jgi:hypothetical protein
MNRLVARLPFIKPPAKNLFLNRCTAEKVFASQMRLVEKSEQTRLDILTSFNKLADKGYLMPVDLLPPDEINMINSNQDSGYIIPWRIVYKEGSLSTPVRMVFDASSRTPGGLSLNEILAKGENRLIRIHDILLRFRNLPSAFVTDIRQCYNQLQLDPRDLR